LWGGSGLSNKPDSETNGSPKRQNIIRTQINGKFTDINTADENK
jgi:hypothetical protein